MGSYHLVFFYRGSTRPPQAATGCHRPPQAARGSGSYHLIFFYRGSTRPPQAATGRHRLPRVLARNPANLPKSVFPPAQGCQIAPLGTLATPVEPKWHQGLAADSRGGQSPPKCDSNSSRICHQANKKTSIQASKHPCMGSQRSAAEAVAFSISIYMYM